MVGINPQLEQLFLWQVGGTVVSGAIAPLVAAEQTKAFETFPVVPLSPADAAEAVLRNVDVPGGAAHEAQLSGVNGERFSVLAALAGNAPDPAALAVALRRGLIDRPTYERGIRQGRLRDEWATLMRELAVVQPSPQMMLSAYLEGQLSESEARSRYAKLGGDPEYFDILYNTQGQAPTPTQALEMLNRGIIAERGTGPESTSYEQSFLEGPFRNKWMARMLALREYLPPPRTITAMHREGALDNAEATALLEKQGLTPKLAAAYLASSTQTKVTRTKELAESTALGLYRDRIIPRHDAQRFIEALGYSAAQAEYILEVEDFRVMEKFITAGVSKVHTLYVGHKITEVQATEALANFGVASKQAGELVQLWGHERDANMREPTPAQIEAAFGHNIIDQSTAIGRLVDMGYTEADAWLVLSVHNKAPLPDRPASAPTPPPAPATGG